MESKPFQFKYFSVAQNNATHKVGTDSVLLGAWTNVRDTDRSMLDIGTGSGVIALMLAQRANPETRIDAVEIESCDVAQAMENVAQSPWPDKIHVYHGPVQQFYPETKYDLIISNPPWFSNSLRPPDMKRSRARHTYVLPFEELLASIERLLAKNGRASAILPPAEGSAFLALARTFRLFPTRKTAFRTRTGKPVERLLLELAFDGTCESESEITLYRDTTRWSEDYEALTSEFYRIAD